MLDYGPEDPQSGEVFDLTALTREIASRPQSAHNHAMIRLSVTSSTDYSKSLDNGRVLRSEADWNAMIDFKSSGDTGHLDDAINASLPDSEATTELRKCLKRLHKKKDKIESDIQIQRLRDAALVRYQHPIARLTESPLPSLP